MPSNLHLRLRTWCSKRNFMLDSALLGFLFFKKKFPVPLDAILPGPRVVDGPVPPRSFYSFQPPLLLTCFPSPQQQTYQDLSIPATTVGVAFSATSQPVTTLSYLPCFPITIYSAHFHLQFL